MQSKIFPRHDIWKLSQFQTWKRVLDLPSRFKISFVYSIAIATINLFAMMSLMIVFIWELMHDILMVKIFLGKLFTIDCQTFVIRVTNKDFCSRAGLRKLLYHLTTSCYCQMLVFSKMGNEHWQSCRRQYSKFFYSYELVLLLSKNANHGLLHLHGYTCCLFE